MKRRKFFSVLGLISASLWVRVQANPGFYLLNKLMLVVSATTLENFESYGTGDPGSGASLTGGTGWNGGAFIVLSVSSLEDFESYVAGSAGNGSTLTGGTNWNGAPSIA